MVVIIFHSGVIPKVVIIFHSGVIPRVVIIFHNWVIPRDVIIFHNGVIPRVVMIFHNGVIPRVVNNIPQSPHNSQRNPEDRPPQNPTKEEWSLATGSFTWIFFLRS